MLLTLLPFFACSVVNSAQRSRHMCCLCWQRTASGTHGHEGVNVVICHAGQVLQAKHCCWSTRLLSSWYGLQVMAATFAATTATAALMAAGVKAAACVLG
jgi:hypothetical protein